MILCQTMPKGQPFKQTSQGEELFSNDQASDMTKGFGSPVDPTHKAQRSGRHAFDQKPRVQHQCSAQKLRPNVGAGDISAARSFQTIDSDARFKRLENKFNLPTPSCQKTNRFGTGLFRFKIGRIQVPFCVSTLSRSQRRTFGLFGSFAPLFLPLL